MKSRLNLVIKCLLASAGLGLLNPAPVAAQTKLSDGPVFASVNVPGNLALALSVEFPTAISVAHPNRSYASTNEYAGYFDPNKCYQYRYTDGTSVDNYFYPSGKADAHTCSGMWSGNYLNWASMQTIDPFRWVLTGGYRVIDTPALTVLEKAWGTSQGSTSNFPDSSITGNATVKGATPFDAYAVNTRIWSLGNKMRLATPSPGGLNGATFTANYYSNKSQTGPATVTRNEGYINYNINGDWPAGVPTTNVSANWSGQVTAPSDGSYNFKVRADDGVRLRVKVNGGNWASLGDTGWRDQGATDYVLSVNGISADDTIYIQMEYYQGGGGAEVSLQWQPPGAGGYSIIGGGATPLTGTPVHYNPANGLQNGTLYEVFVRVKVCDNTAAAGGIETANCTLYPNGNYKPTGLLQKYADKIRYSAFGYLNDANLKRDGGVMRARQKFIGPSRPVPGSASVANTAAEWDANTGVMLTNPDSADATATTAETGVAVTTSGVMNYLNKFGEITPGSYKTYDPVSELYYSALRYYKNLGNVPEWSTMGSANLATKTTWVDGFPVITTWDDPVLYSCQRNFILGIGDVNTHADRNLPGATGNSEPAKPAAIQDSEVDSVAWTNKVGALQGLGNIGAIQNYNGCCNNNGALMAGLAYHANVNDIRPDKPGFQTVQTYWLDVLEYQSFKSNNQFLLAAKYGGFTPPTGYDPSTATAADFANHKSWWTTTADTVNDGSPRPDNYFVAARPDQVISGLTKAFSNIASLLKAYSTSFSTSLPQVSSLGVAAFSAQYDAKTWSGELTASNTVFDAQTGKPTLTEKWRLSTTLGAQAAGSGWDIARNIVTYNTTSKTGVPFRLANLAADQKTALDASFVPGDDSANLLNYLRGERKNEKSSTVAGSTNAYRDRASLLGDIVGAKSRPVAPPAFPFSDSTNPGYSAFKETYKNRTTMVYVGTNAGMLHAVDGSLDGATAGKEVWAYVPSALFNGPTNSPSTTGLASLANPEFTHHPMVDNTPLIFDVDFGRTVGGSGTNWRSVLIGGLGKGGKSIYALDITDPSTVTNEASAASKVLWEFSDPDLGYSFGQPIMIKTAKFGWTLVVGSGYNNADGKGYFFFINPRTGDLLEKRVAPCVACSATNQAGLAHVQAFVLDLTDGLADALYAGDLQGNLWRLDITGTSGNYPDPIKFAVLTGSDAKPLPITSKPLAIVQPQSLRRYVTVGTGQLLDASDIGNTQPQRFFAFLDGSNVKFNIDGTAPNTTSDLPVGVTFPLTVSNLRELTNVNVKIQLDLTKEVGWFLDLGTSVAGPGWRVVQDPASFYGSVAFTATSPSSSDVCEPSGTSRVYALDLGTGSSLLKNPGKLPNGQPKGYYDDLPGVVIDLSFLSQNVNGEGKSRLLAGCNSVNAQGGCLDVVPLNDAAALGLQRLNWREIVPN